MIVASLRQGRIDPVVATKASKICIFGQSTKLLDDTASNASHSQTQFNMVKRSRENSISSASDEPNPAGEPSSTKNLVVLKPGVEKVHPLKYTELDGRGLEVRDVMRCFLPPHRDPIAFSSYEEYDVHYAKAHTNRCLECRKNFPTEHFVGLHIAENHDPLNEARKARGEKIVSAELSMITMLLRA